jgi:thymidylate synthase (FAD)
MTDLTEISVLDHGYVRIVDAWGRLSLEDMPGDEAIIAAARMSTGKGFQGWGRLCKRCRTSEDMMLKQQSFNTDHASMLDRCEDGEEHVWELGDERLLRFLYTNAHSTPFEAAGATFEIMAPIFVFREWHRHRTQSYNEMSSRYEPLPDVNYMPTVERLMMNAGGNNKQAGTVAGAEALTEEKAVMYLALLEGSYVNAQELYESALRQGVPKELARVHLPVGRYSRMRASANLRNWLGFLTLRQAPKAQLEIRVYADAVHDLLQRHFPRTIELFDESSAKAK